ncbi:MAG: YkgJ family cysteine cluster protein [Candidatus Omnitrophica bacterium]|nr:YkgJ family cysteine cluster protein [Candidatus Omnitrophota bacterium]
MIDINCEKCPKKDSCCQTGAWVDLEEAKKILALRLKGSFHHLRKDRQFPSGYKVATSYEDDEPCTFLTSEGLCSIHKVDYELKPTYCKEFPLEDGKLAPDVDEICYMYREMVKNKRKKKAKQKTCLP